jgi:hypothetical protein
LAKTIAGIINTTGDLMIRLQDILNEDLRRWVKEKWVDQNGRPCGNDETKGVKKCRPSRKVSGDTPKTWSSFDKKEKDSLVAQKRRVGMGKRTPKAEEVMDEKKKPKRDACYYKVKASYTRDGGTWPSAYGSLALSACRKKGAKNWGNKTKNEELDLTENTMLYITEACWDGYQQQGMKEKSGRQVPNCVKVESADNYCTECLIEAIKSCNENVEYINIVESSINEAEYQGRKVQLGKPMRGDVKKFKVYVKNGKGNVVKVNFGDPNMRIRKSNPARRRSFRARHRCDTANDRTSARYWSCRNW